MRVPFFSPSSLTVRLASTFPLLAPLDTPAQAASACIDLRTRSCDRSSARRPLHNRDVPGIHALDRLPSSAPALRRASRMAARRYGYSVRVPSFLVSASHAQTTPLPASISQDLKLNEPPPIYARVSSRITQRNTRPTSTSLPATRHSKVTHSKSLTPHVKKFLKRRSVAPASLETKYS